jgi:hypothetical protein
MGWYFGNSSRAELLAEITVGAVEYCERERGRVVWSLHPLPPEAAAAIKRYGLVPGDLVINCFLIECSRQSGWGYKPMDESVGPYYWSVPLSYLDRAPAINAEWRTQVYQRAGLPAAGPGPLLFSLPAGGGR